MKSWIMRPALWRERVIPQIDAEIAEKGNFWFKTNSDFRFQDP
jgi:hypothetical protein